MKANFSQEVLTPQTSKVYHLSQLGVIISAIITLSLSIIGLGSIIYVTFTSSSGETPAIENTVWR